VESRLVKNIVRLASGTLTSRLFGFGRELVCAAVFGAGVSMDLLVAAMTPVTLFRRILGEDVVERAFMPPFKSAITQGRYADAFRILSSCLNLVVGGALVTMFLLILLAPLLAAVVAPGLPTPEAAQMMIWLAPFVLPIALAAVLGGVLNVFECNRVYALAPVFLSVGVITTVWLGHDALGMLSLPLGFVVGAVLQAVVQLPPALGKLRALPDAGYSGLSARHPGLFKQVRWVFCKAFLDKSVEISDRILASLLISGSMSALWFSQRLIQLPLAVIGLAVSRGITPFLAEQRALAEPAKFAIAIRQGVAANLWLLTPVAVLTFVAREGIVRLVFERGSFSSSATTATGLALAAYAIGLPALGVQALLSRVFSVREENRTVFWLSLGGALLNIVLNLVLVRTPLEHAGLALASSASFWFIVCGQFVVLHRRGLRNLLPSLKGGAMILILTGVSFQAATLVTQRFPASGLQGTLLHIFLSSMVVGLIWAIPVAATLKRRKDTP